MNCHGFPKACDHKYLFDHRLDRFDVSIVLARDARRLDVLTHSLIGQPSSLPPEQSPTPTPTAEPVLKAIPIATPTPNPTPSPSAESAGTRHRRSRRHR